MVILSRNAPLTQSAVFRPCGFQEKACIALVSRIVYDAVVRISCHLSLMDLLGDKRLGSNTFIYKDIRQCDDNWSQ